MDVLIGLLLMGAVIYFLPSLIAFSREHHQRGAILLLNIFLGWTLIGWVVALVWAATRVEGSASRTHARPTRSGWADPHQHDDDWDWPEARGNQPFRTPPETMSQVGSIIDYPFLLRYRDAEGANSEREIIASGLWRRGSTLYLRAFCHRAGAPRTFRVDRMEEITDLVTGEIVSDISAHLKSLIKPQPSADDLPAQASQNRAVSALSGRQVDTSSWRIYVPERPPKR